MGILMQATIARFGKAKNSFDNKERMLDPGAHFRFIAVDRFLCVTQWTMAMAFLVGEVPVFVSWKQNRRLDRKRAVNLRF